MNDPRFKKTMPAMRGLGWQNTYKRTTPLPDSDESPEVSALNYAMLWPIHAWAYADGVSMAAGAAGLYWGNNYSFSIFASPEVFLKAYGISVVAVWLADTAGLSKRW